MKSRIYIAGPISKGDLLRNVNQATEAFVALVRAGFAPFCPHWSVYCKPAFRFADKVFCEGTSQGHTEMSHADWVDIDLMWVDVAEAILRLPGDSFGADREVQRARDLGIPVFDSVEAAIDWKRLTDRPGG